MLFDVDIGANGAACLNAFVEFKGGNYLAKTLILTASTAPRLEASPQGPSRRRDNRH